ncbi:hypothetical protein EXIGLDRAFT_96981 [Exidia glandulosa HHB12029]|uniref:Uncharacterized protein n=1 Tax=Exidia glandulosa HHB12029 TaxID=1314781 RepID=A0A165H3Q9_EXIGL|nr:hypothetical protein EXIGLDRAFT_96981 [Exidia glandulosa HHB12029]
MRSAFFYRHYVQGPIWSHLQRVRKSGEQHALHQRAADLDAASISWLVRSSSNAETVLVAIQATGSLHPASRGTSLLREDHEVRLKAVDVVHTAFYDGGTRCGTVTSPADIARLLRVALAQTPFLLKNRGLDYPWSTAAVCDYDLYLLSQIFTTYTLDRRKMTNREVHFIDAPRRLGDKSPFLHSTVMLLLGLRSLSLEPQLALVDLLDFSRITDEDARYVTTALMPSMERNRHTHTHSFPCNRDCLLDVLSDIALTSAYSAPESSCHRIHSMSLVLIRRLLRLQPESFSARSDWPGMYLCTASTQCCIGLVVPHFLDLLTSGLYTGSTELEWYGAASFLSSALDYYGSTRISPIRCEQILCIVTATLRLIPPHETRVFDPPLQDNLLLEMCSVVYALYRPKSLFMYRAKGRASLYRAQLLVAHDVWSLSDGLLPLLKRTEDTPSIWSVIVSSVSESHTTAVSLVLAIQLCSGARRGLLGISSLIDEFFAYNWGLDALRGNSSGVRSDSEAGLLHLMIQHCVELKSDWWENVRARVDVGDVTSESGGGKILHVDPLGAEWRRRDVRYYDRWLVKQRPGPCTMCAACEPPVAPPV